MLETDTAERAFPYLENSSAMKPAMLSRIRTHIDKLHSGDSSVRIQLFAMPHELHMLPLYDKLLYEELVAYHNECATLNRFVHPFTFMMLDPEIGGYPVRRGTRDLGNMQGSAHHETEHYIEMQSQSDGNNARFISELLRWEQSRDGSFEVLSFDSYIHFRGEQLPDVPSIALAPRLPSYVDYLVASFGANGNAGRAARMLRGGVQRRMMAVRQGAGLLGKAMDLEDAQELVFPLWRERNKNKIRMEYYDTLVGYGPPQTL